MTEWIYDPKAGRCRKTDGGQAMSDDIIVRLDDFWPDNPDDRKLIADSMREIERLRAALRECACACSSIRECESEWAKEDYCLHWNARNALEAKP